MKCNNPLHAMTDGTLHPHEIGASCMAGATPPASQPTVTVQDALELLQQVQNDTRACNGFVHADLRVKIKALLRAVEQK